MNGLISQDELSVIRERLQADFALPVEERKKLLDDRIDEILDMLLMQYIYGNEDANEMLGYVNGVVELPYSVDEESLKSAVFKEISGKDWEKRVRGYYESESGTPDDIVRVIETDSHRIYNDAIFNVGERANNDMPGVYKTWETMLDERVREMHEELQSVRIPIGERFYTSDGDSAMYPGDFSLPQNVINCRCYLSISRF